MQIDWFTVAAQVFNFLILVYLLKRFLYGPIIDAMTRRENNIVARQQGADEKARLADETAQSYRDKLNELEGQRQALLAQAKEEAHAQRAALLEQMRAEVAETGEHWRKEAEREKDAFLKDLRRGISRQVSVVARRVLSDLATVELEHQVIRVFMDRLRALEASEKAALAQACRSGKTGIIISTAFDIPQPLMREIEALVHEQIMTDVPIDFEYTPELLCGIELRAPGRKVAWSIESYLEGLERALEKQLGTGLP